MAFRTLSSGPEKLGMATAGLVFDALINAAALLFMLKIGDGATQLLGMLLLPLWAFLIGGSLVWAHRQVRVVEPTEETVMAHPGHPPIMGTHTAYYSYVIMIAWNAATTFSLVLARPGLAGSGSFSIEQFSISLTQVFNFWSLVRGILVVFLAFISFASVFGVWSAYSTIRAQQTAWKKPKLYNETVAAKKDMFILGHQIERTVEISADVARDRGVGGGILKQKVHIQVDRDGPFILDLHKASNPHVGVLGASVDYSEPILVREGRVVRRFLIGEFVDRYYRTSKPGAAFPKRNVEVRAVNLRTLRTRWAKVGYVFRHRAPPTLTRLKLAGGKSITVTGDHSIFVCEKGRVRAKPGAKMRVGDFVVVPKPSSGLAGARREGRPWKGDVGLAKVLKVSRVRPTARFVYDVSVPGMENFIAGSRGGALCHNSGSGKTEALKAIVLRAWTAQHIPSLMFSWIGELVDFTNEIGGIVLSVPDNFKINPLKLEGLSPSMRIKEFEDALVRSLGDERRALTPLQAHEVGKVAEECFIEWGILDPDYTTKWTRPAGMTIEDVQKTWTRSMGSVLDVIDKLSVKLAHGEYRGEMETSLSWALNKLEAASRIFGDEPVD
jgi:hypothetical protein